jgi:N6-adenosine-specific RNA methylase IME4
MTQHVNDSELVIPKVLTCTIDDLRVLAESGTRFGCIYADPPWLYNNQATRAATSNHYPGMTVDKICALPIRQLAADDAHLHLWITNAFLFETPKIFQAWGFEFLTTFVWGKLQMGLGNYWRNAHEFMVTGVRGNANRSQDDPPESFLLHKRARHSKKPDAVREIVQRSSKGPYLEVFGREPVAGWTVWGNEIEKDVFYGRRPKVRSWP